MTKTPMELTAVTAVVPMGMRKMTTIAMTTGAQETTIAKTMSAKKATKMTVTKKKEHAVFLETMHLIVVAGRTQKQTMKLQKS